MSAVERVDQCSTEHTNKVQHDAYSDEEYNEDEDENEDAFDMSASFTRYEDQDEEWLEPFYVMEINKYGFYEPRLFNVR